MVRRSSRPVLGLAAMLAGLALAAGACDDSATTEPWGGDGNDGSPPAYSFVSVWLTDAPGDIAEAWVQIDAIYLQGRVDEDDDDSNGNGDGAQSGRVFLLQEPTGWINLIELDGETMTLVEGVMVPQGTYKQLRFVVGEALLLTEDGMAYGTPGADLEALNGVRTGMDPIEEVDGQLHCPSCGQSGLKVKAPHGGFEITDAGEIMLLDFDASESFGHSAGKSRWIMHPMIKIVEDGGTSESTTGSIAGSVALGDGVTLPDCGGGSLDLTVFVPITRQGTTEMTASVASDGAYTIDSVAAPGDWEMDFTATVDFGNGDQLTLEATPDPTTVTVEPGATATANYTITNAECTTSS